MHRVTPTSLPHVRDEAGCLNWQRGRRERDSGLSGGQRERQLLPRRKECYRMCGCEGAWSSILPLTRPVLEGALEDEASGILTEERCDLEVALSGVG